MILYIPYIYVLYVYANGRSDPTHNCRPILYKYYNVACFHLPDIGQGVTTILQIATVVLLQVPNGSLFGLHFAGGQQLRVAGMRGECGGRRGGETMMGSDADAAAVIGVCVAGAAAAGGECLVRVAANDRGRR